jgi:hypothetical protein
MNTDDEAIFDIYLDQAHQIFDLRKALSEAAGGLWKAAELTAPGYRVPPDCLHRLLVQHRDAAREALERTT